MATPKADETVLRRLLATMLEGRCDVTIESLIDISWGIAEAKGWHEREREVPELLALVHSEVSEALEEWRNGNDQTELWCQPDGKPEGLAVELADVLIRIFDMAAELGLPLSQALVKKLRYNLDRPYRHGGKRA